MAPPTILHVDMDAFYAAVEVLDDPSLAGRPLIVGGTGARGVVAACSYEARVYGVHSAMPAAAARARCPQAVFLPGRFDRYREISARIHAVFSDVTPLVEGIALDEAFLDVAGAEALLGPAPLIAASVRARIRDELGLSCSVGVARSKFLAKLASEAAKPSAGPDGTRPGAGVVVVEEGSELAFLHPLPIEALWGVGPATSARLRGLGLTTVGSLAAVPAGTLEGAVGRAHGRHLHQLALGVDDRPVEPDRAVKSVGHEETYATDRFDAGDLHVEVLRMSDAVGARLRAGGVAGRTVTLKVRYGDFRTITRSCTGAAPLDAGRAIARAATGLLDAVDLSPGVRLLGVSVSGLATRAAAPAEQLTLALGDPAPGGPASGGPASGDPASGGPASGDPASGEGQPAAPAGAGRPANAGGPQGSATGWAAAADAVEEVRRRFGAGSVGAAALLGPSGLRVKRPGDTQWGPSAGDPAGPADRRPQPGAVP